jgi:hypothetical protein
MRRVTMLMVILTLSSSALFGQELVSTFSVDTSQYALSAYNYYFTPEPSVPFSTAKDYTIANFNYWRMGTIFLFLLHKKNSNQYDIFSFKGKTGSIIIPQQDTITFKVSAITLSQKFVDNDDGWDYIINCYNRTTDVKSFNLFDENGNILLSDCGEAFYGFDGENTYVSSICYNNSSSVATTLKTWRFRTNITTSLSQGGLAKRTTGQPNQIMYFGVAGDLRVNLQPVGGGKTSIQLFDMLGKQVYSKTIENITQPISFIISSDQVPHSPFISNIENEHYAFQRKMILAR